MNRAEFVDEVARKASLTRAEAARAVDAVFDADAAILAEAIRFLGVVVSGPGSSARTVVPWISGASGRHSLVLKGRDGRRDIRVTVEDPEHTIASVSICLADEDPKSSIRALARRVWENVEDAEEFLTTPHGLLNHETPLQASRTPEGEERVRRILMAMEYGLPV